MPSLRRLYFYTMTTVSTLAVVWGAILVLSRLLDQGLSQGFPANLARLAAGLSAMAVGAPALLFHWLTAQREALSDDAERYSRARVVTLYLLRSLAMAAIVYSLLALFNRLLAGVMGLAQEFVLVGGERSSNTFLVALAVSFVVYILYTYVLVTDTRLAPASATRLLEARRFNRHLWLLIGLTLTILAAQGMLAWLISLPATSDHAASARLARSIALALTGAPLWAYAWLLLQSSRDQSGETESLQRLVALYLVNLGSVITMAVTGWHALSNLIQLILGRGNGLRVFLTDAAPAIGALIGLAVIWAYYHGILRHDDNKLPGDLRRDRASRFYQLLLAAVGLSMSIAGLLHLTVNLRGGMSAAWATLQGGLAALTIGLPLWLANWLPAQAKALHRSKEAGFLRRSFIRRAYLNTFAIFFAVGVLLTAANLLYHVLSGAATARMIAAGAIELAVLIVLLVYHLRTLRQDMRAEQQALNSLHLAFPVLVIAGEETALGDAILQALARQAPKLPVAVHSLTRGAPDDEMLSARMVVLPGNLAIDPSEVLALWLSAYKGKRLILPQQRDGWMWLGLKEGSLHEQAEAAAKAIREEAEKKR